MTVATTNPMFGQCPVCGGDALTDFFAKRDVPVTCTSVFTTAAEALAVPRGNINLAACSSCGFAFNRSFDPQLGEVSARYESSQAASGHFNTFAAAIAKTWVTRYGLEGRTILEVGCGNGDFLAHLLNAGAGCAIGVDPLMDVDRARSNLDRRVTLLPRLFDANMLDVQADALVCRHSLEHIHDVHGFLRLLQQWGRRMPGRVFLFDLPDAERVFVEGAFWDIYYEHCNYFTAATLRCAFEVAGFRILHMAPEYQGQYLTVEAVVNPEQTDVSSGGWVNDLSLYRSFTTAVRSSVKNCEDALRDLKSPLHPLLIWQGNAKTVGFLSSLTRPEVIDAAVDVSPHRQGIFLPASGLPVYAPEFLLKLRPEHVVLMNPVYLDEVKRQVFDLGLTLQVHPITDLLKGARGSP